VTGVVVLGSSQLLSVVGAYDAYGPALHHAALSTITGHPLTGDHGLAKFLEVALAVYPVAVFATLAGALGAYFLEDRRPAQPETAPGGVNTRSAFESPARGRTGV
jgi:voltage-gated potassium channel